MISWMDDCKGGAVTRATRITRWSIPHNRCIRYVIVCFICRCHLAGLGSTRKLWGATGNSAHRIIDCVGRFLFVSPTSPSLYGPRLVGDPLVIFFLAHRVLPRPLAALSRLYTSSFLVVASGPCSLSRLPLVAPDAPRSNASSFAAVAFSALPTGSTPVVLLVMAGTVPTTAGTPFMHVNTRVFDIPDIYVGIHNYASKPEIVMGQVRSPLMTVLLLFLPGFSHTIEPTKTCPHLLALSPSSHRWGLG